MSMFIVTVKLPKNPLHDPRDKVTGPCPIVYNKDCTDVTGEHHSFMYQSRADLSIEEVRRHWMEEYHVTRVEQL